MCLELYRICPSPGFPKQPHNRLRWIFAGPPPRVPSRRTEAQCRRIRPDPCLRPAVGRCQSPGSNSVDRLLGSFCFKNGPQASPTRPLPRQLVRGFGQRHQREAAEAERGGLAVDDEPLHPAAGSASLDMQVQSVACAVSARPGDGCGRRLRTAPCREGGRLDMVFRSVLAAELYGIPCTIRVSNGAAFSRLLGGDVAETSASDQPDSTGEYLSWRQLAGPGTALGDHNVAFAPNATGRHQFPGPPPRNVLPSAAAVVAPHLACQPHACFRESPRRSCPQRRDVRAA